MSVMLVFVAFAHLHSRACVCACGVYALVEAGGWTSGVLHSCSPSHFFRQYLTASRALQLSYAGWPACTRNPPVSTSSAGITGVCAAMLSFLCGVWGIELRSPCLCVDCRLSHHSRFLGAVLKWYFSESLLLWSFFAGCFVNQLLCWMMFLFYRCINTSETFFKIYFLFKKNNKSAWTSTCKVMWIKAAFNFLWVLCFLKMLE